MGKKIGLIQSRGIGDIVVGLPIAKWYHDKGTTIYWPIDQQFLPSFERAVDYVHFIPFPFQPTLEGFIHTPLQLLRAIPCDHIISLYSYLSNCEINDKALFASLKFDEYKYAVAGVPFSEKWRLSIARNVDREQAFFEQTVQDEKYIVVHRQGSNAKFEVTIPDRFKDHQVIEIGEKTDCIFDWLMVLERAKCLILIDSCFSNLVDQLGFTNEKQFILRSDVRFTPVLRSNWDIYGHPSPLKPIASLPLLAEAALAPA